MGLRKAVATKQGEPTKYVDLSPNQELAFLSTQKRLKDNRKNKNESDKKKPTKKELWQAVSTAIKINDTTALDVLITKLK